MNKREIMTVLISGWLSNPNCHAMETDLEDHHAPYILADAIIKATPECDDDNTKGESQ